MRLEKSARQLEEYSYLKGENNTFGTAAWKFKPVASVAPETWNLAKIITIPGFATDVCGVRVILSSFLSYAVYDVRRGAAGVGAGAGAGVGAGAGD